MQPKIPKTPFSTRLSGSAKETELRIRNIFQWEKKRPPVIAMIVAVLVVALCSSLVGFVPRDERFHELVPGKIGVLAAEEIPGGVVYVTGAFRKANLFWLPDGQEAKAIWRYIEDVDLSTLTLTCDGDILRLEYLQFDDPFEWNDLWITTRYRVAENKPPEYLDSGAILASMVIDQ